MNCGENMKLDGPYYNTSLACTWRVKNLEASSFTYIITDHTFSKIIEPLKLALAMSGQIKLI